MKVGSRKIPTVRGAEAGVSISPEEPPNPPPLVPGELVPSPPAAVTLSRATSVIHAPLVLRAMLLVDTFVHHRETSAGAGSPPPPLPTQDPAPAPLLCSARPACLCPEPPVPPIALSSSTCLHLWTARLSGASRAALVPWVMCTADSRRQRGFSMSCFQKQGVYILRP
ncbi:unnamed protein product [Rangifer tarandus platyrhynchus]|uniref:Uncharacterized protein n=1 Tax=Rangifer tarandus platyrhynchus TaxID=3082113 RepID=A0AC59YZC0_RANTA